MQERWHADPDEHEAALLAGIRAAASHGAQLVCLQELTLSAYLDGAPPEPLDPSGRSFAFAARAAADAGAHLLISLHEAGGPGDGEGLGFNTAAVVSPAGELVSRTRKLHIPSSAGYGEDRVFRPGAAGDDSVPVVAVGDARLGFPTCYDQWFPELARAYALAGADVVAYPTAIGSEPGLPDFDTRPMWQQVIAAAAVANGTFMAAINRVGSEGGRTFYGSSFIADPYGRLVVQAPRDEPAVLVAALDLDMRRDWLEAFPFFRARRPDAYAPLTSASARRTP